MNEFIGLRGARITVLVLSSVVFSTGCGKETTPITSQAMGIDVLNSKQLARVSAETRKLYEECDRDFKYDGDFIHPSIIEAFMPPMSDTGDQIISINLTDSVGSNMYSSMKDVELHERGDGRTHVSIENEEGEKRRWSFGYTHIGRTDSGTHVVSISDWGGGSAVFKSLLLFRIDLGLGGALTDGLLKPTKFELNQERILLSKVAGLGLGDRYFGDIQVEGDEILVGEDQGWFSVSGGSGGDGVNRPEKIVVGTE